MRLRKLLIILTIVTLVSFVLPLGLSQIKAAPPKVGFAYFRYDEHHGAMFATSGRVYTSKTSVSDVLKYIGSDAPNIQKMEEKDIPTVLNFFRINNWEIRSHAMYPMFNQRGIRLKGYSFILWKRT